MKEKIKAYILKEDWKKTFSMARKFFFGLSKDELRSIEIASDCLNGKGSVYISFGIDCQSEINKAKGILKIKYA